MISLLVLIASMCSFAAVAGEFEQVSEKLLPHTAVSMFQVVDINSDNRNDLVYLDVNGELWVNYADNDAVATLDNLAGSSWRMEYNDNNQTVKFVDFYNGSGAIKEEAGRMFSINSITQTENNKLMFCTSTTSGLNKTSCNWKYEVTTVEPNIMKGTDLRTGVTWVAYKLVK
ncbi:hypothetical protein [Photobacterium leiognathi]|uniref:hypothetical protein n=1 Tax=Photobacterium leiognathi TaxID=553611 RepID=UPI0029826998|nr:hypothetical protein [Photobacterium leiognathi]